METPPETENPPFYNADQIQRPWGAFCFSEAMEDTWGGSLTDPTSLKKMMDSPNKQ